MSAPPEHRGAGPAAVAWPVRSDVGGRPPRADLLAAFITVVAGAAGVGQLLLSWSSMVSGVGLQDANGGVTGWERYLAARTAAALSTGDTITAISVVGAAFAGAALLLLGLAMLLPVDHRPLGLVALLLSVAALGGTLWWLIRGHRTFNQSVAELFTHAGPGWYLFIASGLIGLLGSIKALATG